MLNALRTDLLFGLRMITRHPGSSSLIVLILALGIGANTAVFSAVSSVLLAPLPFPDSERMVRVLSTYPDGSGTRTVSVAPRYFHEIRARSDLIEHTVAQRFRGMTVTSGDEPERIVGISVSDGWLETVGVDPILGRGFDAREEASGADAAVTVISHSLWQRRFAGDPEVVGRSIELDGRAHTVIGVMPRQFRFPYSSELWVPIRISETSLGPSNLNMPARLKPGVSPAQFQEELDAIAAQLRAEIPEIVNRGLTYITFQERFSRDPDNHVLALLVAVGFVLLIATVNVANLMLVRNTRRTREMAIRQALGAPRGRQVRQLLIEGLILAAAASVLGVSLASTSLELLHMLIPDHLIYVVQTIEMDAGVLAATAAVTLLATLLFALVPARRTTDLRAMEAVRVGTATGGIRTGSTLRGLVVVQVAMATILLAGAGLMLENLARLLSTDLGYDTRGLVKLELGLPRPRYEEPSARADAMARIEDSVANLPGVETAGLTSIHPLPRTSGNTLVRMIHPDAPADAEPFVSNVRMITPRYLETLGVTLLAGEVFDRHAGPDSPPRIVVNRSLAERFWPDGDAVGRPVRLVTSTEGARDYTVIGVVSDIAENDSAEHPESVYLPYGRGTYSQSPDSWSTAGVTLLVRARGEAASVVDSVRRAVWEVEPDMAIHDVMPIDQALREPLAGQRVGTMVFFGFGTFALLMAMLGTYGVIALSVRQRIPEFGIRMAMGLSPAGLVRFVVGDGMRLVLAGLVIGSATAYGLTVFIQRVVTEVDARDPSTFLLVALVLAAAGAAASLLPAIRARRIDPTQALRSE